MHGFYRWKTSPTGLTSYSQIASNVPKTGMLRNSKGKKNPFVGSLLLLFFYVFMSLHLYVFDLR